MLTSTTTRPTQPGYISQTQQNNIPKGKTKQFLHTLGYCFIYKLRTHRRNKGIHPIGKLYREGAEEGESYLLAQLAYADPCIYAICGECRSGKTDILVRSGRKRFPKKKK